MSLPQELVKELRANFLLSQKDLARASDQENEDEFVKLSIEQREYFVECLNFAYQAGLKEGNESIDKLLEDIEIGHFGTKNRLELIVRLERLEERREKV
jgi:hypothetical protein